MRTTSCRVVSHTFGNKVRRDLLELLQTPTAGSAVCASNEKEPRGKKRENEVLAELADGFADGKEGCADDQHSAATGKPNAKGKGKTKATAKAAEKSISKAKSRLPSTLPGVTLEFSDTAHAAEK